MMLSSLSLASIALLLLIPISSCAEQPAQQLTENLSFQGELEFENIHQRIYTQNLVDEENERPSAQLQLEFSLEASDWLNLDWVIESEYQYKEYQYEQITRIDELTLTAEFATLELTLGKQYLPFNDQHRHFAIAPMLEFAELNREAALLEYSLGKCIELTLFMFRQQHKTTANERFNWGASLRWTATDESMQAKFGVLHNMQKATNLDLQPNLTGDKTGFSAVWFWQPIERLSLTAEWVGSSSNWPSAYNLELSWQLQRKWQTALRVEHSQHLIEEPKWRYGFSLTWQASPCIRITGDWLYSDFNTDNTNIMPLEISAEDEDDEADLAPNHGYHFGVQINFSF